MALSVSYCGPAIRPVLGVNGSDLTLNGHGGFGGGGGGSFTGGNMVGFGGGGGQNGTVALVVAAAEQRHWCIWRR